MMFLFAFMVFIGRSSRLFEQKLYEAIEEAIDDVFEAEYGSLSDSSESDSFEEIAVGSLKDLSDEIPVTRQEFDALSDLVNRLQASISETPLGMGGEEKFTVDYRIIFMIDASGSMTGNWRGGGYDAATGRTRWEKTLSWLANWSPWPIHAEAQTQIWKFDSELTQVTKGWTAMSKLDPWADYVCKIMPQTGQTFTDDAIELAISEFTTAYTKKELRSSEEYAYMLFILTDGSPSQAHGVCAGTANVGPKTFTQSGLFAGGEKVPKIQSFIFGVDTQLSADFPNACWPEAYKAEVNSGAMTLDAVSAAIDVADKEEDVCAMLQKKISKQRPYQDYGVVKARKAYYECFSLMRKGFCEAEEGKDEAKWHEETKCKTVKNFKYSMKSTGAPPAQVDDQICKGKPGDVDPTTMKPFAPVAAGPTREDSF